MWSSCQPIRDFISQADASSMDAALNEMRVTVLESRRTNSWRASALRNPSQMQFGNSDRRR